MFCSRQIGKTFFKRCFGFSSPLGSFINFSLTFGRAFVCCLVFRLRSINFAACRVPESSAFGIWWLGCVYCVSDVWGLSVFQYAILWYTNIYNYMIYDDVWECYIQFIRILRTCHGGRNWFTGFPPVPRCLAQTTTDLDRSSGGRANLFLSGDAESHRESVILQKRMKNQAVLWLMVVCPFWIIF